MSGLAGQEVLQAEGNPSRVPRQKERGVGTAPTMDNTWFWKNIIYFGQSGKKTPLWKNQKFRDVRGERK
jgi:hypothetical protein